MDKYPLQMFSEREFYSLPPETQLQIRVADYLRRKYPNVIFHSDYGSGARLRPKQYKIQSAMNGGRRAWPDLFIAEALWLEPDWCYNGLYIELKKEGTTIYKKNGELVADEHIREQAVVLEKLRQRGYKAEFGVGYEATIEIIDGYLGG